MWNKLNFPAGKQTELIIDLKMDQLKISLDANEEENDIELDSDQEDL